MRSAIISEIESIRPLDELEALHQRESLGWARSGAELCRIQKPATPPRHLVSYFAVIDSDHILLVEHRNAGLWLPPGGHVEPDEHPKETVRREAREELNIDARFLYDQPLMITSTETVGETAGHVDVSLWYLLSHDRTDPITFDALEFKSVQWFRFNEIPLDQSDPHMERFLRKVLGSIGGSGE